jgi:hypothetical protein
MNTAYIAVTQKTVDIALADFIETEVGKTINNNGKLSVRVTEPTHGGHDSMGYTFILNQEDYGYLAYFTVMNYPECCAMYQINGFRYIGGRLSEEAYHWFIDTCLDSAYHLMREKRFVMNLVENARRKNSGAAYNYEKCEVIEPVENPVMKYPYMYSWAKKQKQHREMLMTNQNTGNIIHFTEIVRNI